jgi:hypothetical protein
MSFKWRKMTYRVSWHSCFLCSVFVLRRKMYFVYGILGTVVPAASVCMCVCVLYTHRRPDPVWPKHVAEFKWEHRLSGYSINNPWRRADNCIVCVCVCVCRGVTERVHGTHWIGGWVGPRTGLDDMEKRKVLTLPGLELRTLGRPGRSQSLYRLSYSGSHTRMWYSLKI